MKTTKVYIGKYDNIDKPHVSATVIVPGLGEIEMKDVVSQATIDALFAEVATAAELRLRGHIKRTS